MRNQSAFGQALDKVGKFLFQRPLLSPMPQRNRVTLPGLMQGAAQQARSMFQGPTPTPGARKKEEDEFVQKGFTKAGGGYYKRNDAGRISYIDKQKIPADTLAGLMPSAQPKARIKTKAKTGSYQAKKKQAAPTQVFQDFQKMAIPIFDKYEIPHSVGFGQYAAEGRSDPSTLGASRYNYYNLGAYDSDPNNAYGYDTPEAGIEAYARLIATDPRYAKAYALRADPRKMLRTLAPTYASRPDYADFVMSTPEWRQFNY